MSRSMCLLLALVLFVAVPALAQGVPSTTYLKHSTTQAPYYVGVLYTFQADVIVLNAVASPGVAVTLTDNAAAPNVAVLANCGAGVTAGVFTAGSQTSLTCALIFTTSGTHTLLATFPGLTNTVLASSATIAVNVFAHPITVTAAIITPTLPTTTGVVDRTVATSIGFTFASQLGLTLTNWINGTPLAGVLSVVAAGGANVCAATNWQIPFVAQTCNMAANAFTALTPASYVAVTSSVTGATTGFTFIPSVQQVKFVGGPRAAVSLGALAATPASVAYGLPIAISTTATPAGTGVATFYQAGAIIPACAAVTGASGVYTCTTTGDLTFGAANTITATYSGDAALADVLPTAALASPITKASVSFTQSFFVTTAVVGQQLSRTFTATVVAGQGYGTPTGTVTPQALTPAFTGSPLSACTGALSLDTIGQVSASGRSSIATCEGYFSTVSGAAGVTSAAAITYTPGVNYQGAAALGGAAPGVALIINQATATAVFSSSITPLVTGQTPTITATLQFTAPGGLGANPVGNVAWTWTWTSTLPGATAQTATIAACAAAPWTVTGRVASVSCAPQLQAGTWTVTVAWSGDANYIFTAPAAPFTITVAKAPVSIALAGPGTLPGPYLATAAPSITANLNVLNNGALTPAAATTPAIGAGAVANTRTYQGIVTFYANGVPMLSAGTNCASGTPAICACAGAATTLTCDPLLTAAALPPGLWSVTAGFVAAADVAGPPAVYSDFTDGTSANAIPLQFTIVGAQTTALTIAASLPTNCGGAGQLNCPVAAYDNAAGRARVLTATLTVTAPAPTAATGAVTFFDNAVALANGVNGPIPIPGCVNIPLALGTPTCGAGVFCAVCSFVPFVERELAAGGTSNHPITAQFVDPSYALAGIVQNTAVNVAANKLTLASPAETALGFISPCGPLYFDQTSPTAIPNWGIGTMGATAATQQLCDSTSAATALKSVPRVRTGQPVTLAYVVALPYDVGGGGVGSTPSEFPATLVRFQAYGWTNPSQVQGTPSINPPNGYSATTYKYGRVDIPGCGAVPFDAGVVINFGNVATTVYMARCTTSNFASPGNTPNAAAGANVNSVFAGKTSPLVADDQNWDIGADLTYNLPMDPAISTVSLTASSYPTISNQIFSIIAQMIVKPDAQGNSLGGQVSFPNVLGDLCNSAACTANVGAGRFQGLWSSCPTGTCTGSPGIAGQITLRVADTAAGTAILCNGVAGPFNIPFGDDTTPSQSNTFVCNNPSVGSGVTRLGVGLLQMDSPVRLWAQYTAGGSNGFTAASETLTQYQNRVYPLVLGTSTTCNVNQPNSYFCTSAQCVLCVQNAPAEVYYDHVILPAPTTITIGAASNTLTGSAVLTATIGLPSPGRYEPAWPPTGVVTFFNGATAICSSNWFSGLVGSCSAVGLTVSTTVSSATYTPLTDVVAGCTATAGPLGNICQVPNPNFLASQTTAPATITLVDKFTQIVLTAAILDSPPAPATTQSVSSAIIGQTVLFTAVVTRTQGTGGPVGTVTFFDTEEVTGTQRVLCASAALPASGTITCSTTAAAVPANTLLVGSHRISAIFTGDSTSGSSAATSIGFNVLKGVVRVAIDNGTPVSPTVSGEFVTHTVTLTVVAPASGTPTGSVTLTTNGGGAYTLVCGTAKPVSPFTPGAAGVFTTQCTVVNFNSPTGAGTAHVVSATYNGDNFFAAATNTVAPATRTVTTAPTLLALSASIGTTVAVNTNNWKLIATLSWNKPASTGAVATPIPTIGHGFGTGGATTVAFSVGAAAITNCGTVPVVQYINDLGVASYAAVCTISAANNNLVQFTVNPTTAITAVSTAVPNQAASNTPTLNLAVTIAGIRAVVTSSDPCAVAGGAAPTFTVSVYPVPPSIFAAAGAVVPTVLGITWSSDLPAAFCAPSNSVLNGAATAYTVTCAPALAQGLRQVKASWAGDTNFAAALSATLQMNYATAAFPGTALTSVPAAPVAGQSTQLVLTVAGAPTGTMSFRQTPAGGVSTLITSCQSVAFAAGSFTCTTTELQNAPASVNYANVITAVYNSPQVDTGFCQLAANTGTFTIGTAVIRTVTTTTPSTTTYIGIPFAISTVVSVDAPGLSSQLLSGTISFVDDLAATDGVTAACANRPLVQTVGSATATASCAFPGYLINPSPRSGVRTIRARFNPATNFNYGQNSLAAGTPLQQVQVAQILNVERAVPTLVVASSNANNVWGEAVSWTATISITTGFVGGGLANVVPGGRPVGNLNFFLNGAAIAGATCTNAPVPAAYSVQNTFNVNCGQTVAGGVLTPVLLPGANSITVTYTPTDASIIAPASVTITQNTAKNPTSILLTSDVNPALTGSTLTLTARLTVSAAPGSQNGQVAGLFNSVVAPLNIPTFVGMTFNNGGTALTNCRNLPITQIGTTNQYYSTCVVPAAAGSMTAVYPGTHAYFDTSVSNAVAQTTGTSIAIVTLSASSTTFTNAASITYTAVVDVVGGAAPSVLNGNVAFTDSVPSVGTAIGNCASVAIVPTSSSSGVATCTAQIYRRATPNHVITATYTGTPNNAATTLAVVINPGVITMALSSDPLNSVTIVHAQPIRLIAYASAVATVTPVAGYIAFYTGAAAPTAGSYVNLVPGCSGVSIQSATTSLPCPAATPFCVIAVCTTTLYSTGTTQFWAVFSATNTGSGATTFGDYNDAVLGASYSITVTKASTSILTVVGPNPAVVGQPITIQSILNVRSPSIGIPVPTTTTGANSEVRIYSGSDNLVPICGGSTGGNGKQLFIPGTLTASCSNALFSPGQYDIKSQYPGDANYFSSGVSAPVTLTVLKGNTSLTITSDINPAIQNPTIVANTVVFRVRVTIAAPAAGSLGGEIILRVTSGTSTPYQGLVIGGVTTNIVVCSNTGSNIAQNAATGGITFASGLGTRNTMICITPLTGQAGVLPRGTLTINAAYTGDVNFNGNSTTFTQVVESALSQTALVTSATPAVTGQSITYTATVQKSTNALLSNLFTAATITGNVAFLDGSNTILNCGNQAVSASVVNPLWFIAQCTTAFPQATTRSVTAVFTSTTTGLSSSVSPALVQPVNRANTTTVVVSTPNPSVGGATVAITATVSVNLPGYSTSNGAISGSIAFYSAGVNLCNVTGVVNPITVTLSATCSSALVVPLAGQTVVYITAVYSGDSNFLSSTSTLYTHVISKAPSAVAIAASTGSIPMAAGVTGQTLNFTATVSSTQGGVPTGSFTITYAPVINGVVGAAVVMCPTGSKLLVNAVGWCQVQPATATSGTFSGTTFLPGTYRIQVNYTGDYVYAPSTNFVDYVIAKAPTQLDISGNGGLYTIGVDVINSVNFIATLTAAPDAVITAKIGSTTPNGPWGGAPAITNVPTGPITFRIITGGGATGPIIPACAALAVTGGGGNIPPFVTTSCNTPAPAAGTYILSASYAGDANFLPSVATRTLTITAGTSSLTCTGATTGFVGQAYTASAAVAISTAGVTGAASGTISFTVSSGAAAAVPLCTSTALVNGVGSCLPTALGAFFPTPVAYTIVATFNPDAASAVGASTCTYTFTASAGTLAVALSLSKATVVYGEIFTVTAVVSVKAPAGGNPVGTMTFKLPGTQGTADFGNWNLVAGTVVCNTVAVGATANTYACTTSASNRGVRPGVVPADVGFGQASDTAMCDLTVLGIQSNIGVTWTGTGATAASYTYTANSDVVTLRIVKAATTVTLTSSAPVDAVASIAPPLLTALVTVTTPGGDVLLNPGTAVMDYRYQQVTPAINNPPVSAFATPTFSTPAIPTGMQVTMSAYTRPLGAGITGSYNQRVSFLGDNYLEPSVSAWILQTIVGGTTSTGVLPSANPSVVGQQVTYTATVTILTGTGTLDVPAATVTFYDGSVVICASAAVTQVSLTQGRAVCLQTYNTISTRTAIKATYNGNTNYAGSTSPLISQVNTFAQTTIAVSVNNGIVSATAGIYATVTVNAPGAGVPTGVFTVYEGTAVVPGCVNVAITSNCTRIYATRSPVQLTAVYSGDTLFATSTSAINLFTPAAASTNVTVTSSVNPSITTQTVTFVATVTVLAPAVIGAPALVGVIPTGTVSFSVPDPLCQNRGLALNALVSPTTYQATCTTSFASTGAQTITATYSVSTTSTTAGSTGSITQTVVAGQIVTSAPPTTTAASNTTRPSTTSVNSTISPNATTSVPATTGQLYLVIINFQYCINAAQWAQYRQNLANFLRVALTVVQVVTDPTLTCAAAKRQTSFRSTAVIGFSDLALAQAAVNGINGGQVQSIAGFPDPTAVLASSATTGGGLSGGQIAGIVVGSVLGFFLIVALIVIAFILGKKQGGGSEMSGRA